MAVQWEVPASWAAQLQKDAAAASAGAATTAEEPVAPSEPSASTSTSTGASGGADTATAAASESSDTAAAALLIAASGGGSSPVPVSRGSSGPSSRASVSVLSSPPAKGHSARSASVIVSSGPPRAGRTWDGPSGLPDVKALQAALPGVPAKTAGPPPLPATAPPPPPTVAPPTPPTGGAVSAKKLALNLTTPTAASGGGRGQWETPTRGVSATVAGPPPPSPSGGVLISPTSGTVIPAFRPVLKSPMLSETRGSSASVALPRGSSAFTPRGSGLGGFAPGPGGASSSPMTPRGSTLLNTDPAPAETKAPPAAPPTGAAAGAAAAAGAGAGAGAPAPPTSAPPPIALPTAPVVVAGGAAATATPGALAGAGPRGSLIAPLRIGEHPPASPTVTPAPSLAHTATPTLPAAPKAEGKEGKEEEKKTEAKHAALPDAPRPKGLPLPLRDDIAKFSMEGFAVNHFRVVKQRTGFSSKTLPVDTLLAWQKAPLNKSLLNSSKKASTEAVDVFKNIQCFMGDQKTRKQPDLLAKAIVNVGINKPVLRDEILCQLAKQTRDNPEVVSAVQGWKLLALCVATFPPTTGVEDFLLKYFYDSYSGPDKVRIFAPWCFWRLSKTIKVGPSKHPPSLTDLDNMANVGVRPSSVLFGGSLEYIVYLQKVQGMTLDVPEILPRLCGLIESNGGFATKGIFRIAAEKSEIHALRHSVHEGKYEYKKTSDPHVPADVLKHWLRDLLEPLFPVSMYEACLKASESIPSCVALCNTLPKAHYDTLDFLMTWLVSLARHQAVTSMSEDNIAIVFCMDILRNTEVDPSVMLKNSAKEKNFVRNVLLAWKEKVASGTAGPMREVAAPPS